MKAKFLLLLVLLSPFLDTGAQHTFSIVAVDTLTAQVGSAGATCGDSIIWPGSKGAYVISEILPSIGAINAQALLNTQNKANARDRMMANDSPQQIIDWLVANDVGGTPEVRQYGVVDYNGGSPRTAAYTGDSCMSYANHIIGPYYTIQGNILLGQSILDSMEARFIRARGCLANRLMEALQGANVAGADTRCLSEGTSSLSAFVRVAKPDDDAGDLFIDINVAGTGPSVEPIDVLQTRFDNWKSQNPSECPEPGVSVEEIPSAAFKVHRSSDHFVFYLEDPQIIHLEIFGLDGRSVLQMDTRCEKRLDLDVNSLPSGTYLVKSTNQGGLSRVLKLMR